MLRKEDAMNNGKFGFIAAAFIVFGLLLGYMDIAESGALVAVVAIIISIAFFIRPADDPF